MPVLQELRATGGEEKLKFLYGRLVPYFPQLTDKDLKAETGTGRNKWMILVHRAGQALVEKGELRRLGGRWKLTEKGSQRAEDEGMVIGLPSNPIKIPPSHDEIKKKLVQIGRMLGKYAEEEYQRYDAVWKDSEISPRISHVFEVQVKGKIEGALTKLKHAYDVQRSKPFLVISNELNSRKASQLLHPYLSGSFHEIGSVTTVLSVEDVERIHKALSSIKDNLEKIFE
jgi:hypothetical protein